MCIAHSDYILDTVKLKEVAKERNLGIVVSNNLKPSLQCPFYQSKSRSSIHLYNSDNAGLIL